ncbi:MAG TPA: hypothetical protein VFA59_13700 [Vicinamibacterales bacterium]|nr:hypothetical protein [Vicinamibacterales bacterium]
MPLLAFVVAVDLATVLRNAGDYVLQFERTISSIATEETYHQEWVKLPRKQAAAFNRSPRDLVSTLRLRRTAGPEGWLQFRDVHTVDGKPAAPASRTNADGDQIDSSAKYNIGDINREMINTPLFTLKFLEPGNQYRFRFTHVADRVPATVAKAPEVPGVFRTSTEIWVIEYDERERPTMIRDKALRGKNVPAHGRFWIEAHTGRVLMSEIVAENSDVRATIDVSYQSEPMMGFLVPVEMRERYEGKRTGSIVDTRASYGQFQTVEE